MLNLDNTIIINQLFGISYGIIFSSFLFYFAFYIFNKEKMYLYYAISQLSILLIFLTNSYKKEELHHFLFESFFLIFLISFNFFTRAFLNTKENIPILDNLIKFSLLLFILEFIILHIFGLHLDFSLRKYSEIYISSSIFLLFYLIAAIKVYLKAYKEALFYLFGWGAVIISVFIFEYQKFLLLSHFINPNYILHFSLPLASLILAFALSYKMKLLVKEKEEQKQLVIQQNKLASMGEMLGSIAHQWKQPLTHLSFVMMNLEARYEKNRLTKEYFKEKTQEANNQIEFMSDAINSFKDFFKADKEKEEFSLVQKTKDTIKLFETSFKSNNIKVKFSYKEDIFIYSYKREFSQVIFNLLVNAKDEFIRNNIQKAEINIELLKNDNIIHLNILDNAGGIDKEIKDKIFDAYFSTKKDGLGMGLYMSKLIIEKSLKAKLRVKNIKDGAMFTIDLKT